MRRQLAKARAQEAINQDATALEATAHETAGRGGGASQAALLQEVAAWLTINSMRTERVQFDQLCAQNLANLWRQNAWNGLIDGHEHFKVRPECVLGFVQERLGEAYQSNRLGKVSREHLNQKSLVLYFEGSSRDEELLRSMQQATLALVSHALST